MLYPGMISTGFVAYPAIPWLGITLWGIAHGWSYREEPDKSHQRNGMLSIGFLGKFKLPLHPISMTDGLYYFGSHSLTDNLFSVLFVLIRCAGGHFGNFRGFPRGEGRYVTVRTEWHNSVAVLVQQRALVTLTALLCAYI